MMWTIVGKEFKNSCDVPEWPAEGELAPEQN